MSELARVLHRQYISATFEIWKFSPPAAEGFQGGREFGKVTPDENRLYEVLSGREERLLLNLSESAEMPVLDVRFESPVNPRARRIKPGLKTVNHFIRNQYVKDTRADEEIEELRTSKLNTRPLSFYYLPKSSELVVVELQQYTK